MGLVTNPSDIRYFGDHMKCSGCHLQFCHLIKEQQDTEEHFCMQCFNNRNGLEETLEIIETMNMAWYKHNAYLWETPVDKIPKEIYDTIPFVKGKKK